ncbi:hypothetical protein [Hephaestia mangrovi]|uniref:hypothetical protein n=1 Tax=Hephaestia mangrovi TaxID=2873268 RepID=UPI001CA6C41E|nr:hypothetical protein [Hephaestia mangrovi]MBY8828377.1 hypothetical protein [Hephaestia mangrovi]
MPSDAAPSIGAAVNDDDRGSRDSQRMTVLFTSAGTNVALIRCFRTAATTLGIALRVLAADQHPDQAPACLLAEGGHRVPSADDDDYLDEIEALCRDHHVGLVVPCGVRELGPLSTMHDALGAFGTRLALAPAALVDPLLDLWQWQEIALGAGAAVPRIGGRAEIAENPDGWRWPLVARAIRSGGNVTPARIIRTPTEMLLLDPNRAVVLQEIPRGERFVLQLLFDDEGTLLGVATCHIIAGADSDIARTVNDRQLTALARRLAKLLPMARGPLAIDAVRQADGAILIDRMLPMLADTYPLVDCAGAKMAQALLAQVLGRPLQRPIEMEDHFTMLTYPMPLFLAG